MTEMEIVQRRNATSSSDGPTFLVVENVCSEEEFESALDLQQEMDVSSTKTNFNIRIKQLRIPEGTCSTFKKLRILLMGELYDPSKNSILKECLAVCYSIPFQVRSNQAQLSKEVKAQRKSLLERKIRTTRTHEPDTWTAIQETFSEAESGLRFFITNVGKEQLQTRNIMGEMKDEGRYPTVHLDEQFFRAAVRPFHLEKFSLEFHLVNPSKSQKNVMSPCENYEEEVDFQELNAGEEMVSKIFAVDDRRKMTNPAEEPMDFSSPMEEDSTPPSLSESPDYDLLLDAMNAEIPYGWPTEEFPDIPILTVIN